MRIIGNSIMAGGASGPSGSIFVTGLSETDTVKAVHKAKVQMPNPVAHGLPDGYTELEYIESTGTQQIKTGLTTSGYRLTTRLYVTEWNTQFSNYDCYFSGGYSGQRNYMVIYNHCWDIGGTSDVCSSVNPSTGVWYEFDGSTISGNQYIQINDITVVTSTETHSNEPIFLFSIGTYPGKCRMGGETCLYDSSNNLVCKFIPAKRNSDGAIGMYNLITDTFFENAGTGEFIAGPEIPAYIESFIEDNMLIGKWTQKQNPVLHGLPDGYTQLEYIESTGTQYINTGVSAPDGFSAVFDFILTSVSTSDEYLIGAEEKSSPYNCNFFRFHSSKWEVGANTTKTYTDSVPISGERYYAEVSTVKSDVYLKINNASLITSTDSNTRSSKTLYLFARYNGESVSGCSKTKLFSCKLTVGGNLIRNFIPCKRNSDGSIGLYDLVSNTFFENSGTGEFVAGSEIPQTFDGFMIKPIRDFGTWTVTATDGVQTATQDVLVDVITEYEIEMSLAT